MCLEGRRPRTLGPEGTGGVVSGFIRFEAGELLVSGNGRLWDANDAPWICPTSSIGSITVERDQWGDMTEGGPAVGIEVYMDTPRGAAGMPALWVGTPEALLLRLNGGRIEAEKLSGVLQRLLVELDGEMAKKGAA